MMLHVDATTVERIQRAPSMVDSQSMYKRAYRLSLILSDALMLALAFGVAYFLRFTLELGVVENIMVQPIHYVRLVLILIPLWLPLFSLMRLYDFHYLLGGTAEYAQAFNACTSGMMLVILVTFVDPTFVVSRAWLIYSWLLSALFVCSGRLVLRRAAYHQWEQDRFLSPAIIIGTNQEAVALANQLRSSKNSGLTVLGFVHEGPEIEPNQPPKFVSGLPVLGSISTLPTLIERRCVGEIIIASTALSRDQLIEVFSNSTRSPGVEVRLSSGLYEILTTDMRVTRKGSVPLMNLNRLRLDPVELFLKSALDYALILGASLFLAPLFLVIGLLIKLDSPGPVFHRRKVMGIGGKEFYALKFRTMVMNGDELLAQHPDLKAELEANHKLKYDPRVTRIGAFLRRTSLDELPQLLNVLQGRMSLVGPRMITAEEGAKYGQMKMNLLTVKPGLTGLWQVSGRSDLSYEQRVSLDMDYIRNYSIWLDLQILFFQTLPAVLRARGAY